MKHTNDGNCQKCEEIFNRYPGFDDSLKSWFNRLQEKLPHWHISCAGRGRVDQESLFERHASKAHWKESAHNYNAAIDLFVQDPHFITIYPIHVFQLELPDHLPSYIKWYGQNGSEFFEMPHCELIDWREKVGKHELSLVE